MPDHAAGDIVRHVVMRRGGGAIADPDADDRRIGLEHRVVEDEVVLGAQTGQIEVEVGGADVEGRGIGIVEMGFDASENRGQRLTGSIEVHRADVVVVEESPLDY